MRAFLMRWNREFSLMGGEILGHTPTEPGPALDHRASVRDQAEHPGRRPFIENPLDLAVTG